MRSALALALVVIVWAVAAEKGMLRDGHDTASIAREPDFVDEISGDAMVAVGTAAHFGILADNAGNPRQAATCFHRAAMAAGATGDEELRRFLECAEVALAPVEPGFAAALPMAGEAIRAALLAGLVVNDPAAPDEPDHSKSLTALQTLVAPARAEYGDKPTLDNKIKLLTALILFGELASRPEEQLYADANVAFRDGLTLLAETEQELKDDPEKDRRLSENRPLAVRFDVIRFRQAKVREKSEQSLKLDRERTEKLQELVIAYRDMAGEFSSAMAAHLAGDEPRSLAGIDKALEKAEGIRKVVESERDYYLLTKPPAPLNDDSPDDQIIYNPVSPFTPRLASESLVLRGMSRFRLPRPAGAAVDAAELRASLRDIDKGLAKEGQGDPGNVLGLYAAGVVHEAQGDLLLEADPVDKAARKKAAAEFREARDFFTKARQSAKGQMQEELGKRLALLEDPRAVIDRAAAETGAGNVAAASRTLGAGIRRHDAANVWSRWAAAAARAGQGKAEIRQTLERAITAGVVDAKAPVFIVAFNRAVIDDVLARTSSNLEKLDRKTRESEAAALAAASTSLKAVATTFGGVEKAACEAYESLAAAYRGILLEGEPNTGSDVAEAYALSKTSHATLAEALGNNAEGNDVELQEAIVACRLALGYLATATVPEFQDDAIAAFSGVLDEQSRLPGDRENLKVMGAPLVSALRDRPLDAGKQSVNYEQRLRRSMVSLLDGAVSMHYGVPDDSARFLEEGLTRLRSRAADTDALPDAASLFDDSDTFEVERYLEDFMSVFAVLAEVDAGRGRDALEKAIRRVDPDVLENLGSRPLEEVLTTQVLERVLNRTKSPMGTYAVGRALEAYALSLELTVEAKTTVETLLAYGRQAIEKAKAGKTPWLESRYPAFVRLVGQSESRLAGPESYLAQVRQLRGQGRLDDAVAELRNAVRLYRSNRDLWRLWVEIELAKAVAAASADGANLDVADRPRTLEGLREVIKNGQANGAFSAADELYFSAVVEDRLGNAGKAIERYSLALAENDLDQVYRVRAKSRLAVLRLDVPSGFERTQANRAG